MNVTLQVKAERLARKGSSVKPRKNKQKPNDDNNEEDKKEDELFRQAGIEYDLESDPLVEKFRELNSLESLERYGFEEFGGSVNWIYPTNFPVRDYQFDIAKTALFNNTLIVLPQGFGTTFITSVVVFNLWRWYPSKKILYLCASEEMAESKLKSYYKVVGVPANDMIDLSFKLPYKSRARLWKEKKVFFCTPELALSDIKKSYFDPQDVRLIVVDDAYEAFKHKTTAAFINSLVVANESSSLFRIVACSRISKAPDLLSCSERLFKTFLLSQVELRHETDDYLLPYVKKSPLSTSKLIPIVSGYPKEILNRLSLMYQKYAGSLMKAGVLACKGGILSEVQLQKAKDVFWRSDAYAQLESFKITWIEQDIGMCMVLSKAISLLNLYGLYVAFKYLNDILTGKEKVLLVREMKANKDFDNAFSQLQSFVEMGSLQNHPKYKALLDILSEHWKVCGNHEYFVLVITQNPDSATEITQMLRNQLSPMGKSVAKILTGNNCSLDASVFVSTELISSKEMMMGLVINFDLNLASMKGSKQTVITFLSSEKEKEKYNDFCENEKKRKAQETLISSSQFYPYLFKESPRMIPMQKNNKSINDVPVYKTEIALRLNE